MRLATAQLPRRRTRTLRLPKGVGSPRPERMRWRRFDSKSRRWGAGRLRRWTWPTGSEPSPHPTTLSSAWSGLRKVRLLPGARVFEWWAWAFSKTGTIDLDLSVLKQMREKTKHFPRVVIGPLLALLAAARRQYPFSLACRSLAEEADYRRCSSESFEPWRIRWVWTWQQGQ